jgi:CBS domain containing-hemolysin-like protein
MTWLPIVLSVVLAVVAGMLASVDAAISAFSKARAEELETEGRSGAAGLVRILDDPAAYLNSVLLMRVLTETASIVLVALVVADHLDGLWPRFGVAVAIMVVVSFVLIGVGPRTLGRQHAESIALASTVPVIVLTRMLARASARARSRPRSRCASSSTSPPPARSSRPTRGACCSRSSSSATPSSAR